MADVFISYSKGDASPFVKKIGDALENAGISCWYMEKDSLYGVFAEKIGQEIFSCKVFLLILDKKSNQSQHVQNEVGLAFRRFNDKQPIEILPVNVDGVNLSYGMLYYLNRFTVVDAHPSDEKSVQDLVKRIADILGKDPSQPDPPPAKIIKRGECGEYDDNVTYELDQNGVLTISGYGPMRDFDSVRDIPWWDERETISRAIFNGVTSIGDAIFFSCANLVSVDIPDSVTEIGWGAFLGCASLASVDIPDSVTKIGLRAFYGCRNLKSVSVPAEAHIMDDAFPDTTEVIRRPRK